MLEGKSPRFTAKPSQSHPHLKHWGLSLHVGHARELSLSSSNVLEVANGFRLASPLSESR